MSQTAEEVCITDQMVHKTATDILPGGIAAASPGDWRLLRVTEGLAALMGRENPEELIRAAKGSLLELFPPEERPQICSSLARLLTDGGSVRLECRLDRPEGLSVWTTFCAGLAREKTGEICLECFFLDIAGLGAAEAELEERCRQLVERNRRESMTGLLNKEAFQEDVVNYLNEMGPERPYALLIADLDDFKQVNDRWGHAFGDRVLLTFADLLTDSFPAPALLGRYGGDEFVVFLGDTLPDEVEKVIQKLYRKLKCRRKGDLLFQCSVGAACNRGGVNYGALFERADTALYLAKRMGKNRYIVERM